MTSSRTGTGTGSPTGAGGADGAGGAGTEIGEPALRGGPGDGAPWTSGDVLAAQPAAATVSAASNRRDVIVCDFDIYLDQSG